jgi:hypothetical protein
MPVVFPGFSAFNLRRSRGQWDRAIPNKIPRRCGDFMWRQVYNLLGAGVTMMYGAMFDEVDEGTAMLPTVARADQLPTGSKMVYLNIDGCQLPDDWYLRVAGKAAEALRNRQIPPPDLSAILRP